MCEVRVAERLKLGLLCAPAAKDSIVGSASMVIVGTAVS